MEKQDTRRQFSAWRMPKMALTSPRAERIRWLSFGRPSWKAAWDSSKLSSYLTRCARLIHSKSSEISKQQQTVAITRQSKRWHSIRFQMCSSLVQSLISVNQKNCSVGFKICFNLKKNGCVVGELSKQRSLVIQGQIGAENKGELANHVLFVDHGRLADGARLFQRRRSNKRQKRRREAQNRAVRCGQLSHLDHSVDAEQVNMRQFLFDQLILNKWKTKLLYHI